MAHHIESTDGLVLAHGKPAWHGLGVVVPGGLTAAEAIHHAGIDWQVIQRPLYAPVAGGRDAGPDDGVIAVPDAYALIREDINKILGTCGKRYTPVQNTVGFDFFDPIVSRKEAIYETVGSLHGGKVVWILAKIGDLMLRTPKGGEDKSKFYVMIYMPHDGMGAIKIKLCLERIVCANTLAVAMNEEKQSTFSIRHTASAGEKIAKASKAMGLYSQTSEAFAVAAQAMLEKQLKAADTLSYLERCFGVEHGAKSRHIDACLELIETGAGTDIPGVRGTVWGAMNAVTERIDHKKHRSDDARLDNALFDGALGNFKAMALSEALALLK